MHSFKVLLFIALSLFCEATVRATGNWENEFPKETCVKVKNQSEWDEITRTMNMDQIQVLDLENFRSGKELKNVIDAASTLCLNLKGLNLHGINFHRQSHNGSYPVDESFGATMLLKALQIKTLTHLDLGYTCFGMFSKSNTDLILQAISGLDNISHLNLGAINPVPGCYKPDILNNLLGFLPNLKNLRHLTVSGNNIGLFNSNPSQLRSCAQNLSKVNTLEYLDISDNCIHYTRDIHAKNRDDYKLEERTVRIMMEMLSSLPNLRVVKYDHNSDLVRYDTDEEDWDNRREPFETEYHISSWCRDHKPSFVLDPFYKP